MSLTINTNIQALNAQRNLNHTEDTVATSMERLSSGLKINSAADDVAGYAINERLQSQINGLAQAQQNSQDAVALSQTAQGALNEVSQMLQRVRELAVQYENGTNSESDKEALEGEVTQLNAEIKRVGETTSFNGISLLSEAGEITFQVGANEGASEKISVKTIKLSEAVKEVKLSEKESIKNIEEAISSVTKAAGEFGAVQDRLQYTQANLSVYSQNLTAAKSS
ncbi:MAG TPA: flagellin, partial [Solirubrobacteraceae bacterium]|nr:flagellin [Solirubrobacteraceae bacterium]